MIEKIKAEIERQSERNTKLFQDGAISVEALTARDSQLMIIRTFIESLEKEQEVNLEKEIEDYYHTNLGFILSPVDTRIIVEEIARHFYELGLNAKEKSENPTIRGWVARDKGAKWMAGQGETKKGVVAQDHFIQFTDGTYIDLDPTMKLAPAFDLREGDVVDVSVRVRKVGRKETPDVEDALAKIGAMVAAEQRCDHEEEYTKTKRK